MIRFYILLLIISCNFANVDDVVLVDIIRKVDKNLNSRTRITTSDMIIHGRRN